MRNLPSGGATRVWAALALAGAVWAAPCLGSLTSSELPRERYDVISQKQPFGPPPPTQEELDEAERKRLEELAKQTAEPEPIAEIIPEGLDKIKITLLSRYHGVPAVGFIDGTDNRSYYLREGWEFEGIGCEAIDFEHRTATLTRNGRSAELPLWINPATTNCADVTTYGQPGGRAVDPSLLQTKTDWEIAQDKERDRTAARDRMEEARARREAQRAEREQRRKEMEEEMASLTPEQRERRLHRINVDIIKNNSGPPLPIELDAEDRAELREAGFDVPDESEIEEAPRPRGPRGRRFGGPPGPGARVAP